MYAMAKRKGRYRRLDVPRQPDGRPRPEAVGPAQETIERRIDMLSELVALHPRHFAAKHVMDGDASWYIGRLHICGQLTNRQRDAAESFRRVVRAYQSVLGGPKQPHALDIDHVAGRTVEDEARHTKRFQRAKQAYERHHDALSACGRDVVRAVSGALRDEHVDLTLLRRGLDALGEV